MMAGGNTGAGGGGELREQAKANRIADMGADERAKWAVRFWAKVDRETNPDGCWFWTRRPAANGYGQVRIGGGPVGAHCAAYVLAHGPIPPGRVVLHGPQCEEHGRKGLLCVNPEHLEVGTHGDNMDDKNSGWFRLNLDNIPISAGVRNRAKAFMPHALAVLAVSDIHPATGLGEGQIGDAGKALTAKAAERDRKGR